VPTADFVSWGAAYLGWDCRQANTASSFDSTARCRLSASSTAEELYLAESIQAWSSSRCPYLTSQMHSDTTGTCRSTSQ
jgi:hypothetical protein